MAAHVIEPWFQSQPQSPAMHGRSTMGDKDGACQSIVWGRSFECPARLGLGGLPRPALLRCFTQGCEALLLVIFQLLVGPRSNFLLADLCGNDTSHITPAPKIGIGLSFLEAFYLIL